MTIETKYDNPLSSLRWYRLSATLLNIRSSPAMTAHPFTVFQAVIKGVSSSAGFSDEAAVFFHLRDKKHTYRLRESDRINFDIFFCGQDIESVQKWREVFQNYLSDPVTGKNFDILELGEVEERSYDILASETGQLPEEGELGLEFLTPFPFRTDKERQRTHLTVQTFLQSFEKRFSRLFGEELACKCEDGRFFVLPYYWHYTEIRHPSHSQPGNLQYINGCAGMLYIKGVFKNLLPLLILGSELHTGVKLSNAQGYYRLHKEPPGYFKRYFPNQKIITSVIKDVINRYDNALEALSAQEKFPFNEEKYAEELFGQIEKDTCTASPNTAFLIKKKKWR
jgi:hypothetical protein